MIAFVEHENRSSKERTWPKKPLISPLCILQGIVFSSGNLLSLVNALPAPFFEAKLRLTVFPSGCKFKFLFYQPRFFPHLTSSNANGKSGLVILSAMHTLKRVRTLFA